MKKDNLDAITYLQEILKIDTVEGNPLPNQPFGECLAICLANVLGKLTSFGCHCVNLDNYCGYADYGNGELFGILAHIDVVPVDGDWTYPPFGGIIADNVLYGRGTMDDKGPLVACMYAFLRCIQEGLTPTKKIRFIIGCDEESGWKCIERYSSTEEMPKMGFSPDANFPVINTEKGIVYHTIMCDLPSFVVSINAGSRANVVPNSASITISKPFDISKLIMTKDINLSATTDSYTLRTSGVSAHGSHPELGDNALIKLFGVLKNISPCFWVLYNAFNNYKGDNISLNFPYTHNDPLTLNLGTAKTVKNQLIMELDIRHPIDVPKEDITAILKSKLPNCEVIETFYHLPLYVDSSHILVNTLLDAYNSVMGTISAPITIGGGTYARCLPLGVAFGAEFPGETSTIHMVDEHISLANFDKMIEIYYRAIKSLCF